MTNDQKEALLTYIDNRLMDLCEQLESHVDPDTIGFLYESMYEVLNDFEDTFEGVILYDNVNKATPKDS